ncbi:MAG: hypothetical protein KME29_31310 [Calothrix sp. FI2-JRJ7]|jgi:hypothetical protein|nr:hypothetical protein [Calothrix sp. FI2-JRJ7]
MSLTKKATNKLSAIAALVTSLVLTTGSIQGDGVKMVEVCYKGLPKCTPELTGVLPAQVFDGLDKLPSNPKYNRDAVLNNAKVIRELPADNPNKLPLALGGLFSGCAAYFFSRKSNKDAILESPAIRSQYEYERFISDADTSSLKALAKARAKTITATRIGALNPMEIQALQSCITPDEYADYGWALDSGENGWKMEILRQQGYSGGVNLNQLASMPLEAFYPAQQEARLESEALPAASISMEEFRGKGLEINQALVNDADKSKLGGCVILAAPGAGKTTFLGVAWGKLKQTYADKFKSLAVVVKKTDVKAFSAVADKVISVKDSPLQAAIEILKFISASMHNHGQVRRLFLDDYLTMNKILQVSLSGIFINPQTFEYFTDRKEDPEAVPAVKLLEASLNEIWLVGREYDSAVWVSSHSSNIDTLPFVGSRDSRGVGQLIYLSTTDKREFLYNALTNNNLLADNKKRETLLNQLESLGNIGDERLVLANHDNWTLGVVPQTLHTEYQNYRILWESSASQPVIEVADSQPIIKLSGDAKKVQSYLDRNGSKDIREITKSTRLTKTEAQKALNELIETTPQIATVDDDGFYSIV